MNLLENKNILITGGSRGIGKGIVYKLVENGANVAFTYSSSSSVSKEIVNDLVSLLNPSLNYFFFVSICFQAHQY